ncbi:MAG: carbon-nitrogen hydrolase family protein [Verrucomicrobia bacterium]|nr:carbon-nitrogen hydrolase family protein [Verrucomicrobiota bacterium]
MNTLATIPHRTGERAFPFHSARINADVMFARYKVAAVSIRPKKWAKSHNADKMEAFFRKAAKQKPNLIVATEGMLDGYVILDVIWHPERASAALDIAEPLDGPYMTRFRKLARTLKTCLCFGFLERIGRDAFNSAVFIDHRGNICGTYHKLSEGSGAYPGWNFCRPGRQARALDTPLGRCGMLICSDRWIPLLARTLVLDGAQFLLIPTYGSVNKGQNQTLLSRAWENGVPVVQANAAGNNLIISRGKPVAYKLGVDRITTAFIDIPRAPSPKAARACEREFLKFQRKLEKTNYQRTMAELRKRAPSRDVRNSFLSERAFRRLRETNWGKEDFCHCVPVRRGEPDV